MIQMPIYGDPVDEHALAQLHRCAETAVAGALMADHHLGYSMPIGGVVAYEEHVSPSGVGYDIACGNKAVRTNLTASEVMPRLDTVLDEIFKRLSFGVGLTSDERVEHELFADDAWAIPAIRRLHELARSQLGTIGGGNHYVDLMLDDGDQLWIACHFGSRGFGHKIATHYIKAGGGKDGVDVPPVLLHQDSELGQEYVMAMRLAGRYAYAGRDWVCDKVLDILGAVSVDQVHNHHNFAWQESHLIGDEQCSVWVIRKGATPAFPGDRAFIGGSMGDDSYIVEGIESSQGQAAMYSAPHGAGRVMSRTAAAGKYRWKRAQRDKPKVRVLVRPGRISPEQQQEWLARKGVVIRGGGLDESPQAYKRLADVLGHHRAAVGIQVTLRPIGVCMAPSGVYDPFRD